MVGGRGAGVRLSNVNVTQRYDMSADSWESVLEFTVAKADFGVGRRPGDGLRDRRRQQRRRILRRLDLRGTGSTWGAPGRGGTWEDLKDPLPGARTANNAGISYYRQDRW